MTRASWQGSTGGWLETGDRLRLAVQVRGPEDAPTVLAVHGYPDDHTVWDGVVDALSDRYRVVTYDVRGAGGSDRPETTDGYLVDQLADDLFRVADAVSPDRPVHLLAHDWGSVQSWHAVTEPRAEGRIASYTSLSGPGLDHYGQWLRSKLRPNPRDLRELATQLAFSAYIAFFQLPALPELAWRSGIMAKLISTVERMDPKAAGKPTRPVTSDGINGLELYRANAGRLGEPVRRHTGVPVQVLAPTGDPFVSTPLQAEIEDLASDLRVRRLPGGHWLPRSRPELVARCAAEFVDHVEGGEQSRGLRSARVLPGRGEFADQLVVITGAGNGIGRATAQAFAAAGAHVVAADVDLKALRETGELLGDAGTTYEVDVSDQAAMADFAQRVSTELGTPDVVINNAGIGLAGAFLDTTVAEWEDVIDVNLWGVIHGCRLFGRQMAERGEGGRIINVASAAAYLPSRVLPAYSTTKAAVLRLSECLRVELAADGVKVTAVCPGLVNTGITTSSRFAGTDEAEQAKRRRAATELYQRRDFSPQRAADEILRATRRAPAIAPVTPEARAGLVLSRLTPRLLRAAARVDHMPK
ncbi:SDR family oxidoreductase [Saccharopolyspora dendranthemae]|uniref:Short-subunit dehydrogenase n=1 Tax=Saccharopolyspora dendranthemae TaxID=1181886 RepID=A0A561U9E9_9PSEU|nr:SDR family oxidoreductase [Saccharopolyspora dendranthemae]TWF95991.1 short-subunit dehydrogenase [Saccharopolyspora dendranthemae]